MSKNKKDVLDQYGAERFGRLILSELEKNVGLKGLRRWSLSFGRIVHREKHQQHVIELRC